MMKYEGYLKLPALPTRIEVADFCNRLRPDRPHPVTSHVVRGWEKCHWIAPHPAHLKPVRYRRDSVIDFLEGRFK